MVVTRSGLVGQLVHVAVEEVSRLGSAPAPTPLLRMAVMIVPALETLNRCQTVAMTHAQAVGTTWQMFQPELLF